MAKIIQNEITLKSTLHFITFYFAPVLFTNGKSHFLQWEWSKSVLWKLTRKRRFGVRSSERFLTIHQQDFLQWFVGLSPHITLNEIFCQNEFNQMAFERHLYVPLSTSFPITSLIQFLTQVWCFSNRKKKPLDKWEDNFKYWLSVFPALLCNPSAYICPIGTRKIGFRCGPFVRNRPTVWKVGCAEDISKLFRSVATED